MRESFSRFWKNKIYVIVLALTAACSYGFMITNYAIGIDDTPYAYYFEEGLAAIVGRWVCFLLNKIVNIAEFAPFLTDLAGVLILMVAVTVWSALLYSVLKDAVPLYGYLFFACIFISCPLISEVYVYYLHNGIAIGYLCSGLSLWLFLRGLDLAGEKSKLRKTIITFACSSLFLWVALGCYESFMMVWLMGVCLILMLKRMCGVRDKIFPTIGMAGAVAVCSLILRSITISLVTAVFHLEYLQDDAVQRSIAELVGWMFEPGAFANFAMALKRTYVMYFVFGCAYYPITIFVLAALVIVAVAICMSIRRKDAWIFLLTMAGFVAAFSLVVIEGKATYYRAAQFVPVVCGLGALLLVYGIASPAEKVAGRWPGKWSGKLTVSIRIVTLVLLSSVLWNQCADMNKWFYLDYQKYEAAKDTMYQVVYELEKGFDTSKPVVFTGIYENPSAITQPAYVNYGTETYFRMIRMTEWLDEHLLEKFYRDQGVMTAQMPTFSVIEWGRTAFDTDEQLVNFFRMHGYELIPLLDGDYEEAESLSASLPSFPQEGSILDAGEYLIVHF